MIPVPSQSIHPEPVHEAWIEGDAVDAADSSEPAAQTLEVHAGALPADLARSWLAWQCQMVAGVIRGAIFTPTQPGSDTNHAPNSLLAVWPEDGVREKELNAVSQEILAHSHAVIHSRKHYGKAGTSTCDYVGCPLLADDRLVGVLVLMISTRSKSQQQAVLQLLQWGGLWIEKLVRQHIIDQQAIGTFSTNLTTAALAQPTVSVAAMEIVNRLADRFECDRVSLGMRRGMSIHLQSLSHVGGFDPRTQLVRQIEAAMEEAVDQATAIVTPTDPKRTPAINRAHLELARQQDEGAICTVSLHGLTRYIGALTFERKADQPFDQETVAHCETMGKLIGPILEIKQRDERPLLHKAGEALRIWFENLLGPSHLKLKIALPSILLLIVVTSLVDSDHRVTAPATIEGAIRHMLVAPQDGYMKQAEARAGDLVKKGDLIASLDDSSLQLELQKWQSEKNKIEKTYQEALALRNRTKLSIARAQISQIEAELKLVAGKIARTRLVAPFDGVIVNGDFSQSIGAPVKTGQVLFEVAPLDSYLVILEVDEYDVADFEAGKSGLLIIAALPQSTFALSVRKIVPVAVSSEGRNYFRVEATLDEASPLLRPGMQGVAKITMGQRKLLWIWTHSLVDRLRLWAWSTGF